MLVRLSDPKIGAANLLRQCAEAQPGERLLIVTEPPEYGYFRGDAAECLERTALELGLFVRRMDVGFSPRAPRLTPDRIDEMARADIVVFLARLGDQLRFSDMPECDRIVVCFALDAEGFSSPFCTVSHDAMVALQACVVAALKDARSIRVTCPNGTDFSGAPSLSAGPGGDVTVRRFPMSVFQPVLAEGFSGQVALPGFLTGTGSRYYEDYTLEVEGPLLAHFRDGRLTEFTGSEADVRAANAHYDRVAERFALDRNAVHSWHAGIHPGCGYADHARDSYERWGGVAFGNPRLLHMHTCGTVPPGEICWNVLDPTIVVDGTPVWDSGAFRADRLPGGDEILSAYPELAALFASPDRRVGL